MQIAKLFLICMALSLACFQPSLASIVTEYQPVFLNCRDFSQSSFAIRKFLENGKPKYLVVQPDYLQTKVVDQSAVKCAPLSTVDLETSLYGSYLQAGQINLAQPSNAGLSHLLSPQVFLTVDMCPSSRAFEKEFFDILAKHQIPLGLALSGKWLESHRQEFSYLQGLNLKVTWINHSLNHPYQPGTPDEKNFFLLPGVDVEHEIFGNEVLMIENGLTPSIFVRLPGLISNAEIIKKLTSWGLVPTGSNAWLALDEAPKSGSIILVHGNGNEPAGIRLFLKGLEDLIRLGFGPLIP